MAGEEGGGRLTAQSPLERFVERYGPRAGAEGPGRLVREVFRAAPDAWQGLALRDFGQCERQIAVESAHGVGKTALLAWLIWIQLLTRFPQKAVATAPAASQMGDALLPEVRKWHGRLPEVLQELFELKADRIELKAAPAESFATFRTARPETPQVLAGIHSDGFVLLIVDEASDVPEPIFEAGMGSMSGHNATTVLTGNPVRTGGFFYNACHGEGAHRWRRYHVAAIPGVHCAENSFVSPRVSPEFVELVRSEYGEGTNQWRVRILGRPPQTDADAIIPFEWVELATTRDVKPSPLAPRVWGVDVGRSHDLTALAKRQAHILLEPIKTWPAFHDIMLATGALKAEWDLTVPSERPVEVLVDAIGLGAGVADRLRELGLPVRGINVSEHPALSGERYRNLRTELWFQAREWFAKRDCWMPKDPKLVQELTTQKYKPLESSGKVMALPKDDMRKFLHPRRSPDRADAFILTFAGNAATALHGGQSLAWNQPLKRGLRGVV